MRLPMGENASYMTPENSTLAAFVTTGGMTNSTGGGRIQMVGEAEDAVWILTSTFIIFTMQSGFGLLESGTVSTKNEVNIMVKNAVDVIAGGVSFWMFGYAFGFGKNAGWTAPFTGLSGFLLMGEDEQEEGKIHAQFFFQSSFATTATTIVSGGMAERVKLEAYIVFSVINTLIYCFPAHWVFSSAGWLHQLGMIDIAGCGPVHLVGGTTALVATIMLKPRTGRYDHDKPPPMGCPTNAVLGMFMLWWGWLGFNCGSTFGISGFKWRLAAKSAVSTVNAATGGGLVAMLLSYIFKKRTFDVGYLINGVLASLVSITALCALARPYEGFVIGCIGATIALFSIELLDKLKIDDPVGCIGVHLCGGIWGVTSVGLFTRYDEMRADVGINHRLEGLFHRGGPYLLGIQLLGAVSIIVWTVVTAYIFLKLIDITIGLRVTLEHERLGADIVIHGVRHRHVVEYWQAAPHCRSGREQAAAKHPAVGAAAVSSEPQSRKPRRRSWLRGSMHRGRKYGVSRTQSASYRARSAAASESGPPRCADSVQQVYRNLSDAAGSPGAAAGDGDTGDGRRGVTELSLVPMNRTGDEQRNRLAVDSVNIVKRTSM